MNENNTVEDKTLEIYSNGKEEDNLGYKYVIFNYFILTTPQTNYI